MTNNDIDKVYARVNFEYMLNNIFFKSDIHFHHIFIKWVEITLSSDSSRFWIYTL